MGLFRFSTSTSTKMKVFALASLALALAACVSADGDENARLLVSKNVLNQYLVEGQDLTVMYNIFNVGGSAAVDVQLVDHSFPAEGFEKVQGSLEVSWSRIAAGTNVSHSVIMRPLQAGIFNFTSAEVSYKASEEAETAMQGYSSAPGQGRIMYFKDYDRKFSPHMLDWGAFAIMCLPSLGMPFLLWYSSSSKYDSVKAKKN